jgi:WD40 repeat protein
VTAPAIGTDRAVEVLHNRGPATLAGVDRWASGSGYLIGGRSVLTAAHNVTYRQSLSEGEQLLVRTIGGRELAATVVLVCDETSQADLALLAITDPDFDEHLPQVSFAQVNRDSPAPVSGCWAVGFPRFGEAGPVLPAGSRKETWQVRGEMLPGAKRRAGLLSLQVTSAPAPPPASLAGSAWDGMSGSVVFATGPDGGDRAIGVITAHHRTEGESALTVVPITAVAGLLTAPRWWQQLGVTDPESLTILPLPPSSVTVQRSSRLTGERAMQEHWDPRARGVERGARPGWFFTGRHQALSRLVAWLTAAPAPADNVRVVTGGPGSGKSAVLARLVTMSNPRYRAGMPEPLAPSDPVAGLPAGSIHVAVHARDAPTDEVVSALAAAAGAPQADLDSLIEELLKRHEAFTIVVDALDEANDPPTLAAALRQLAGETADAGVRLLVGTRPGGPHGRLITALGLSTRAGRPAVIDLDDPVYMSLDDLTEYVRRRLLSDIPPGSARPDTPYQGREALAAQVAAAVADAAYPTFLIGQLVSRALLLRSQPVGPHEPGWQQFPKTVADAMDQYLESVGDQAEQDRVEDLLRPLAYARGDGLPLDDERQLWPQLANALARPGRSYTVGEVVTLLDTAADYLIETIITGQAAYFRLYHQALSDRLRERDKQHSRAVSAERIVYQSLLSSVAVNPGGDRDWATAHPYLHHQLAGHAADANMIDELLADDAYLLHADLAHLMPLADQAMSPTARLNARLLRLTPQAVAADPPNRAALFSITNALENLGHSYGSTNMPAPYRAAWASVIPHAERAVLDDQMGEVSGVCAFSINGRVRLATVGKDATVRVWDPATGQPLSALPGHTDWVRGVCSFTLDGQVALATTGNDGTVRIWDPAVGGLLAVLADHVDGAGNGGRASQKVAYGLCPFTLDGQVLLASAGKDGTVRIWDPAADQQRDSLNTVAFGSDGIRAVCSFVIAGQTVLATAGVDGTVRVWNPVTGQQRAVLQGHSGIVKWVCAFNLADHVVLASAGGDGTVRIWDPATGQPQAAMEGHTGQVNAVCAFSLGDHVLLASAGGDGTVRIWNPPVGRQRLQLRRSGDSVHGLCAFLLERQILLASAGTDGTVRIWDPASGQQQAAMKGHTGHVNAVRALTLDGQIFLASAGADGTVRIWDPATSRQRRILQAHDSWVKGLCLLTKDDQVLLASAGADRVVRIWDAASGQQRASLVGHTSGVNGVCTLTFNGETLLASAGGDGTVRIWDSGTGQQRASLAGHIGGVNGLCVLALNGQALLASAGADQTARIWDPVGQQLAVLQGHADGVSEVCPLSLDGSVFLATASFDRTVRIFDPLAGVCLRSIPVHHAAQAICQTGDLLAVGLSAGLIAIDIADDPKPSRI